MKTDVCNIEPGSSRRFGRFKMRLCELAEMFVLTSGMVSLVVIALAMGMMMRAFRSVRRRAQTPVDAEGL
jgi:hypothetical protein